MSDENKTYAAQVRAVFEQTTTNGLSYAELYAALNAAGMRVDSDRDRDRVSSILRYLVAKEYLSRTGERESARFRRTGKAMTRPRLSESQRTERKRDKYRRRAEKKRTPRAASVGVRASMIPKPVLAAPAIKAVAETVEQYEARGGKVERLTAHWERAA